MKHTTADSRGEEKREKLQQQLGKVLTISPSIQYGLLLGGSHAFHTETGKPGRFAPKLSCYYLLRFKEESGNIHFSLLSQVGFTPL
jgi:hypothetical protein